MGSNIACGDHFIRINLVIRFPVQPLIFAYLKNSISLRCLFASMNGEQSLLIVIIFYFYALYYEVYKNIS